MAENYILTTDGRRVVQTISLAWPILARVKPHAHQAGFRSYDIEAFLKTFSITKRSHFFVEHCRSAKSQPIWRSQALKKGFIN